MHVLLVGAGNMATHYAKILISLNIDFTVVGRGEKSASNFEKETGKKVIKGGLNEGYKYISVIPTHAIVTSSLDSLEKNAIYILEKGVKNLLIEKPGSTSKSGLNKISVLSKERNCNSFIAYNRRFYASVYEAEKRIKNEGGLKSVLFEFTEWGHILKSTNKSQYKLDNWFIANSTHLIDLAYYFAGLPKQLNCIVTGGADWHSNGVVYTGAGITEREIPFSYHANWEAPGSWKLELLTTQNRYIFRPIEKLKMQKLGSMDIQHVEIDDDKDLIFKPGIFEQVKAFLFDTDHSSKLLSVEFGTKLMDVYYKMGDISK